MSTYPCGHPRTDWNTIIKSRTLKKLCRICQYAYRLKSDRKRREHVRNSKLQVQ
jgi:hypothetical protein